jgi:hypothetical protein
MKRQFDFEEVTEEHQAFKDRVRYGRPFDLLR